ncbi:hypothetical protein K439DRAFT_1366508 [Ramaria rubella]|nr:hypothetical protein K439DRAFT_1366508 [Ramaria rubella]
MDDALERPSADPQRQQEEDNEVSGEEDEGPDWTKIKSFASSSSRPSLPKRGDKEFEPAANGPTNLQAHSLNRARDAMFSALKGEREISNKSVSYAVWYPELARAHVTQMRGVLFNGIGHSVARPAPNEGGGKVHKRTELLPEETLYLVERGSMFCWKDEPNALPHRNEIKEHDEHELRGSPMSVQQAYIEMIGRDDLTLDRYHTYAYLKRLGFNVLRANPPTPSYPAAATVLQSRQPHPLIRFFNPFLKLLSRLRSWLFGTIDWWRPLHFGWLGCARDYASVYRALRIIPSGHKIPLHPPVHSPPKSTPYEIFYNVYKPTTPFRKSAPPPPDFSVVVVNARTTPLPSLHELTHLWSFLPESGPPVPRQRNPAKAPPKLETARPAPAQSHSPTTISRLFSWLVGRKPDKSEKGPPTRKPHPFAVLKGGKKTIIIGVVDSGTVGFFRFGMGAFEEMPMI